jgi:hypothetical protein
LVVSIRVDRTASVRAGRTGRCRRRRRFECRRRGGRCYRGAHRGGRPRGRPSDEAGPRVAQLEIYKDFGRNGQNLSVSGLWQSNLANVRWPDGSPVDNSISRIYNTGGVPFYMCFYADPNYRGFLFSLKPGERKERIDGGNNDTISSYEPCYLRRLYPGSPSTNPPAKTSMMGQSFGRNRVTSSPWLVINGTMAWIAASIAACAVSRPGVRAHRRELRSVRRSTGPQPRARDWRSHPGSPSRRW